MQWGAPQRRVQLRRTTTMRAEEALIFVCGKCRLTWTTREAAEDCCTKAEHPRKHAVQIASDPIYDSAVERFEFFARQHAANASSSGR